MELEAQADGRAMSGVFRQPAALGCAWRRSWVAEGWPRHRSGIVRGIKPLDVQRQIE